jgi:hypothetical protein
MAKIGQTKWAGQGISDALLIAQRCNWIVFGGAAGRYPASCECNENHRVGDNQQYGRIACAQSIQVAGRTPSQKECRDAGLLPETIRVVLRSCVCWVFGLALVPSKHSFFWKFHRFGYAASERVGMETMVFNWNVMGILELQI